MSKNIVIPVVILLAVLGVVMLISKGTPSAVRDDTAMQVSPAPTVTLSPTATTAPTPPRPQPPVKGDVFADSAIKPMAYEVWPGKLDAAALVATKGWTIKSTVQKNGMTLVEFIPTEQEDKKTSYTVKKGQTLYFVELNPGDDTEGKDNYLLDDYGVIVGADGLVQ